MDIHDLFVLGITLALLSPLFGVLGLVVVIFFKKYRKYGIISIIISLMMLIIGVSTSIQNIDGCGSSGLGGLH